jgi:hypothetical protein
VRKKEENASVNNLDEGKGKQGKKPEPNSFTQRFISKPPDRNLLFEKSSFMMQRAEEKDTNKISCQFFFFLS